METIAIRTLSPSLNGQDVLNCIVLCCLVLYYIILHVLSYCIVSCYVVYQVHHNSNIEASPTHLRGTAWHCYIYSNHGFTGVTFVVSKQQADMCTY